VMRSKLSTTKARFPSMVMWLKIGGGCLYFWICKGSPKEVNLTTSLPCDEFCPCFWGIVLWGFTSKLVCFGVDDVIVLQQKVPNQQQGFNMCNKRGS
jgi:hypothetical protein